VLVSELLDVAAQYHADAGARDALIVRHTLQPFAPAAFGTGDARRFSYRRQWWEAAAQSAQRRMPLRPWFGGVMPSQNEWSDTLTLDALRGFLRAPAETFLRQRLGLRLAEIEDADDDIEPLVAPGRGLQRKQLQQAVFKARLRGEDDLTMQALLRARGLLPSGPLGAHVLATIRKEVDAYADQFKAWRGDATPQSLRLDVPLDGVRLLGRIVDVYPQGVARVRFGAPNGNSAIRDGLDWLLMRAAGLDMPFVQFHDSEGFGLGPHAKPNIGIDEARTLLAKLMDLRVKGLYAPLPFVPYSGWELFKAPTLERGLNAAMKKWAGSDRAWGEGQGEALRLALRGREPFTDEAMRVAFVDQTMTIFSAVVSGQLYQGIDLDALREIAADLDVEDSE
jgi:exodeoxyribonuclease V gamma subunit